MKTIKLIRIFNPSKDKKYIGSRIYKYIDERVFERTSSYPLSVW